MKMNANKPITLAREDFIQDVVKLCNNCNLPFFVIEDVLKNITQEIHLAAKQQLEDDKRRYEQMANKD